MALSIDVDDEQYRRLEARARQLGVDPGELAKAVLNDLLNRRDSDFEAIASRVLEKNRELYRRLS